MDSSYYFDTGSLRDHVSEILEEQRTAQRLYETVRFAKNTGDPLYPEKCNPVKINPIKNDPDAIQLPSSKQTQEEDFSNNLQEENLLDDENYSDKNSIESSSKNIKNAKKLKVN